MKRELVMCAALALMGTTVWARPSLEPKKNADKEENVYVLSDAEGNVSKVIVSGWLKNPDKKKTISDVSDLKDMVNVKGDETFTEKSGNRKVWTANGNDIFYQGTSENKLPVSIKISYFLDGKKVTAEQIAGKSGNVKIRFDYKVSQFEKVVIDGKKCEISPAFLVMSGLLMDNEDFRNIKVSTGKIINDGNRSIVVGVALPGMQENLGLDSKDFQFPSFVEITAETKDFSLITMMSLVTNEVISGLNLDDVNSSDELSIMISNVTGKLNAGIEELSEGVIKLDDGMHSLNTGLSGLSSKSDTLREGADHVFQALFDTAESTFRKNHLNVEKLTIENYHQVLEPLAEKLIFQKDKKQVLDLIESLDNYKKFYDGVYAYTKAVDKCYEGSVALADGTSTLREAVSGIVHGSSELVNDIANFQDDSLSLLDGMEGIDRETLEKLIHVVAESEAVLPRLKATVNVTEKYQSFTGLSSDMTGRVRFIYRTSGI
ncbi:MAG: hypothetical protein MJ182_07755 [Treponema sp.]|nr:hypothetical protein [Treponema sp.]